MAGVIGDANDIACRGCDGIPWLHIRKPLFEDKTGEVLPCEFQFVACQFDRTSSGFSWTGSVGKDPPARGPVEVQHVSVSRADLVDSQVIGGNPPGSLPEQSLTGARRE